MTPDPHDTRHAPHSNGDGQATDEPRVARPMDPADSPGWFGYIAVGIAVVSMLVALVVVGWMTYALVRRLMWGG